MKQMVTVKFKDGNKIVAEAKADHFGLLDLGNEITLSSVHGSLYRRKGNVICGEDITDKVDTIEISMKY